MNPFPHRINQTTRFYGEVPAGNRVGELHLAQSMRIKPELIEVSSVLLPTPNILPQKDPWTDFFSPQNAATGEPSSGS